MLSFTLISVTQILVYYFSMIVRSMKMKVTMFKYSYKKGGLIVGRAN